MFALVNKITMIFYLPLLTQSANLVITVAIIVQAQQPINVKIVIVIIFKITEIQYLYLAPANASPDGLMTARKFFVNLATPHV